MNTRNITVCICTYKRPEYLKQLLNRLLSQVTGNRFHYSITIADNDREQTAVNIVSEFIGYSPVPILYCVEPEQNISLARNKAIKNSTGDFIAFIDDDEIPDENWLLRLFQTCEKYDTDGVLGPVKPYFECEPPRWIKKGKYFERPSHKTGHILHWSETRTGNVLFKKEIVAELNEPFNPAFGTGSEDVDFFQRMITQGYVFVWDDEATIYEIIPPVRYQKRYQLRLALLRGGNSFKHRTSWKKNLLKSMVAFPIYSLILPFLFLMGEHHFMNYLIRLGDHTGRILAFAGFHPIKKREL